MHREKNFEDAIEQDLLILCGYQKNDPKNYDKDSALFPQEIIHFIQASQPKLWQHLAKTSPGDAQQALLNSLASELQNRGMLDVLRYGFKCYGKTVRVAYFQPNTALNPDSLALYRQNRVAVSRQVKIQTGRIPDLLISVNGLPIATLELKNALTGSGAEHAKEQYRRDRDPRDPLYRFKERCLVHFAVGAEEVWMTTKLAGQDTHFLPFNRGHNHGAGNPPVKDDYAVSYLWREILEKDSLLEILGRFLHLQSQDVKIPTAQGVSRQKKETLIFPRYHQLDVVRKLTSHAKTHQAGHNYLIQHSAGSGKSNSIAWLAHRLANLHNADNEKIFHSVIIITDRSVLDSQLQETVYQFDHKAGVVQKITDVGTRQPDQETPLSNLIDNLNERFGTDFTLADQLFFEQIVETASADDTLKQAAQVNSLDNFAAVLDKHIESLFLERMEGNEKIFMQMMNDNEFRAIAFEKLLLSIYERLCSKP